MDLFKEELALFEEKKAELLKSHEGQFALIKGRNLVGVFPTEEEAYKEGIRHFGLESFFIKKVVEEEKPEIAPLLALAIGRAHI
ncbi:MAG: hypothetical protein ACE5JJ_04270 [Nitrospinota bacterium]